MGCKRKVVSLRTTVVIKWTLLCCGGNSRNLRLVCLWQYSCESEDSIRTALKWIFWKCSLWVLKGRVGFFYCWPGELVPKGDFPERKLIGVIPRAWKQVGHDSSSWSLDFPSWTILVSHAASRQGVGWPVMMGPGPQVVSLYIIAACILSKAPAGYV